MTKRGAPLLFSATRNGKPSARCIGNPSWTQEERFTTLLGRVNNAEDLDKLVEEWTVTKTREEVMKSMQAAGVPAGVVNTGEDVWK